MYNSLFDLPRYLLATCRVLGRKNFSVYSGFSERRAFEKELGDYLGVPHVIATGSGTDALIYAYRLLGIGNGDEIIIPAFGFIATASAAVWVGARPVFVDVCTDNFTIDVSKIEAAITPRTKAIVPVHLFGSTADMKGVQEIAKSHSLFVVEDATQALGTKLNNAYVGTIGTIGCFSFSPMKQLVSFGNGGALITHDQNLFERGRYLSHYGARKHYTDYPVIGTNAAMQELQAALLRVSLCRISEFLSYTQKQIRLYMDELNTLPGVVLHPRECNKDQVYSKFVIQSPKRDNLFIFLRQKLPDYLAPMVSLQYEKPIPHLEAFQYLKHSYGDFPVSEKLSRELLSLPVSCFLSLNEIRTICTEIRAFYSAYLHHHISK